MGGHIPRCHALPEEHQPRFRGVCGDEGTGPDIDLLRYHVDIQDIMTTARKGQKENGMGENKRCGVHVTRNT